MLIMHIRIVVVSRYLSIKVAQKFDRPQKPCCNASNDCLQPKAIIRLITIISLIMPIQIDNKLDKI